MGLARHPTNPAIWIAGADVGGVYVTRDNAKTWNVCNSGIATKWIFGVEFLDDNTPLLATTNGVYRGHPSATAGPCVWNFTLSVAGLQVANATETLKTSKFAFRHPVRVLHIAASNNSKQLVWAGIGIAKNRATPASQCTNGHCTSAQGRLGDPFHLYVSNDGGQHWRGVLRLPGGVGQILSISSGVLGGHNKSSVVVSTGTTGSYLSDDDGQSWVELGMAEPLVTRDAGETWTACTPSTCPERFNAPCNTSLGRCLPLNSAQNETHPNGICTDTHVHVFRAHM